MTKHDRTHRLRFLLLNIFAASTLLAASSVHAANGTWNVNANGLWSTASNWTNDTIANDLTGTASFTNNITADRTVSLDSDRTINRVNFGDSDTATAGSWILDNNGTATNNLILSGTTGAASGTVPVIDVVSLGTGKTATISAIIEGTYGFNKTGAGTLILAGNNTFSGAVLINSNGGTVIAGHNNALGTASISLNSNTALVIQDGIAINNSLTANEQGNFKGLTLLSGATSATYSGNISILETVVTNFDINVATGGTLTISGSISGNSFEKVGAGTVILAGVNTYGSTTITGGIVAFANKSAKPAGTATAGAAGSVGLGVKAADAAYYSATDVGNLFNTNTLTGFSLNAASGVAIDTTNAGADFDQTVALTAGRSLTKLGTGTLILSQANTYTGATTISGGILSINGTSALQGTSGVTIAGGAGLTYTGGAAADFGKSITVTAGSGTGTIRNSGGLLTLSGNLSKDNSVLRLTGGAFNVTGTISGTTAGTSDLLVDGTSSVTLSAANTYNGPTFVIESSTLAYGINNAIPSNSVVTLGNASSQGTLSMSGYTGEIGGLAFGSAGGTLQLAATSTSAAPLTASSGTMTLTNGTLDLAGSGTTAGLYRVLSAQSVAGAFTNITGTSAAYQVITSATSVDYQQRAVLGAVSVTNPVVSIITGGSAAFTYTVANSALSGGAGLGFTAAGLANVAGSSSGTATAGGPSGAISGLVFTGTSVGSGQTGGFTVTAPAAFGATTATGTVAVTVLDHALPGFLAAGIADPYTSGTLNINFGSIDESAGVQNFTYSLLNLASQTYGAGLTAGLDFTGVTADGEGFASGLTTFNNLVGGGTSSLFTFTFTPSGQGSFNKQFTLSFSDQNLSGASTRRDLTIVGNVIVVPEPGAIALAGVGIALVCWTAARRTCRSAR